MLSDRDVAAMEAWVEAARGWGEASQDLVGAGADLARGSRELAVSLDGSDGKLSYEAKEALAVSLRLLGEEVEAETAALRDRYMTTAANLEQYRQVLG